MYYVARLNGQFWSNAEGYQPLLEAAYRVPIGEVGRFTAPLGGDWVVCYFEDPMPLPSEARLRGNPESTKKLVERCYPGLRTWDVLPQGVFEELSALCGEEGAWGRFVWGYWPSGEQGVLPVTQEASAIWEAWIARQES